MTIISFMICVYDMCKCIIHIYIYIHIYRHVKHVSYIKCIYIIYALL